MTLYESEASCGGHTLTDTSSGYPVDLGFQVYNLTTYPHLVGLFERLGVETQPSEMSFALSMDGGRVEWGSHGLDSVFAQRSNLASPAFLGMIRDVLRFGRQAPEVLAPEHQAQVGRRRQGIIWYLDGTCRRQHCRRAATPAVPSCCRVFSRLGGEAARQCCERLLTLPSACLPACLPPLPPPLPPPPLGAVWPHDAGAVPGAEAVRYRLQAAVRRPDVRRRVERAQRPGEAGRGAGSVWRRRRRRRPSSPQGLSLLEEWLCLSTDPHRAHSSSNHHNPCAPLSLLQVLDFPVVTLVRFWSNHHLLDMLQRPLWRVVSGRSKQYVDKIVAGACRGGDGGGGRAQHEAVMDRCPLC